jgi:hypothetical protein
MDILGSRGITRRSERRVKTTRRSKKRIVIPKFVVEVCAV